MWQEPWWSHSAYRANQKSIIFFLTHCPFRRTFGWENIKTISGLNGDLVAPRKKIPSACRSSNSSYCWFKSSSTRSMSLFMETIGFSQTSYYSLGFRRKVSEVKRRSQQPQVWGKEEIATGAQEGTSQSFCGELKGGKKRKWHAKIILQDTE